MLSQFYPCERIDSVYRIDFAKLYGDGYRGVIFDVDNTLVPHNVPADAKAKELFETLRSLGYGSCLLSNNKEPRVNNLQTP